MKVIDTKQIITIEMTKDELRNIVYMLEEFKVVSKPVNKLSDEELDIISKIGYCLFGVDDCTE